MMSRGVASMVSVEKNARERDRPLELHRQQGRYWRSGVRHFPPRRHSQVGEQRTSQTGRASVRAAGGLAMEHLDERPCELLPIEDEPPDAVGMTDHVQSIPCQIRDD